MGAALLSIGTELTRGELVNGNATWLAEQLTALGFSVDEIATVPDHTDRVVECLQRLSTHHRALVCTGGLGPTTDDLTAAAVAQALGVPLVRHEPSLEAIRRRYAAFGREVTSSSAKQADLPQGAEALSNPIGTAPGFAVTMGTCRAYFLPGVPEEMSRLYSDHVQPALARLVARDSYQLKLRTFGMPESAVGEKLAGIEDAHAGLTIGYRVSFPELEVKLLVRAASASEAEETANKIAIEVRDRLGDVVFGRDDERYPAHVGRLLRDRGLTISVAESCTGGMLGSLITSVPGSSEYLLFDAVTYSNAAKSQVLGVSGEVLRGYGAVSLECAEAMAEGARRVADSDLAVSITGIAGPGGGTEAKPVGTVCFGLARRGRAAQTTTQHFAGDRERIRMSASYFALRLLAQQSREP